MNDMTTEAKGAAENMKGMTAAEVVQMSVLHPRLVREQRNSRIRAMRSEGKTLQFIGEAFGLTRARVQQICNEPANKPGAKTP